MDFNTFMQGNYSTWAELKEKEPRTYREYVLRLNNHDEWARLYPNKAKQEQEQKNRQAKQTTAAKIKAFEEQIDKAKRQNNPMREFRLKIELRELKARCRG